MRAGVPKALIGALLLSSLVQPIRANATTIFSDFGAGHSYTIGTGWTVSGPSSANPTFTPGMLFTSGGNYSVSQIDLGLGYVSGTNSADVSLWTDSGGVPGSELGLWPVSGQPTFGSTSSTIATISGISGVNLISGDSYFLVIGPGAANTWDAWNLNSVSTTGLEIFSKDGGSTWLSNGTDSTLGAFDVLGTATTTSVPEPATLALFGAGLLGLGASRRRKAKS